MTLKEKKKALRTKSDYDASSPTSEANDSCVKNVLVDVMASQEEQDEYTAVLGGMLTVQIAQADITEETTDAITNAANEFLTHGMGVAGAISEAGGP